MLNIKQSVKQKRLLRALTRLNEKKAFDALLLRFTEVYESIRQEKSKKRAVGRYRKACLKTSSAQSLLI